MTPLTDTPQWSPRRWAVVYLMLGLGAFMVTAGGLASASEATARAYIENGVDLLVWTGALVLAAASGERGVAWWSQLKQARNGNVDSFTQ